MCFATCGCRHPCSNPIVYKDDNNIEEEHSSVSYQDNSEMDSQENSEMDLQENSEMDSEQNQDNYDEEGDYHENGVNYENEDNPQEEENEDEHYNSEEGEYIVNDMEDPLFVQQDDEQNGGVGVFINEEND